MKILYQIIYDKSTPHWLKRIIFWTRLSIELLFNIDTTTAREREVRQWCGIVKNRPLTQPRAKAIGVLKYWWQQKHNI